MASKNRRAFFWLRRREDIAREVDVELRLHLDLTIEELMAEGMDLAAARQEAERRFGHFESRQRECTEFGLQRLKSERRIALMSELIQDLRYGMRMLVKNPGFTAVAILSLALGIGANTAIFSIVNAALLRSLPYPEPDRLVMIWEKRVHEGVNDNVVSPADFLDWRTRQKSFEAMASQSGSYMDLSWRGEPERIDTGVVSSSFFEALGVMPAIGRSFILEEEQEGRHRVVIVGHPLWQRQFGSDPSLVGKTVNLSGEPYEVIGILPESFRFPNNESIELWRPMTFSSERTRTRANHFLQVFARLKPGVTLEQARAEMDQIGAQLAQEYPDDNNGHSAHVVSLHEQLVGDIRPALLILLSAVGLVLLIACVNVANLLLARAATRQREVAIRAALGAGRARIARQLLTESALLALLGGAAGVGLALWGMDLLKFYIPEDIPRLKEIAPDGRVFGYSLAVSLLAGVLFGLVPAWQSSKPDINETLKESGRSPGSQLRHRLRSLLVISEIALALVLLIGAGLMIQSFLTLQQVKPGFNADSVLTMQIILPQARYIEPQQMTSFFQQAVEKIGALPGVNSVGAVTQLPLGGMDGRMNITIEGRDPNQQEPTRAHWRAVTPGYFQTMQIPLLEGRLLAEHDTENSAPVVLINRTAAERYWPAQNPLGKRFRLGTSGEWMEIVGVIGDVKHTGLATQTNPEMYFPFRQFPRFYMTLVVRADADPASLIGPIRGRVREMDKDLPVADTQIMSEVVSRSVASPRFYMLLLSIFAAVSLLLAAAGIYGVMSYWVTQRRQEIGIRMALGARRGNVLGLVLRQGFMLTLAGVVIGGAAAFALTRIMASLLFGISATDFLTFAGVSLLLTGVALLACYLPARRAMKVDPMVALRAE